MLKNTPIPRNFGFVITVTSLGLVLISLLIFLYNVFFATPTSTLDQVESSDGNAGYVVGGKGEDMIAPDRGGMPGYPVDGGSATNEKDQKLVKTGTFDITVDDFDDVNSKIRSSVKELGGFVVSSNDNGVGVDRDLVLTVKVPAGSFDLFVEKVKGYAVVVNSYSENTADITQVYQDLKARLKNEKALEVKLLEILDKAVKVSDLLEVQRELSQVQQNIEVMQSQIEYYDSQIDMSVVSVSMGLSSQSLEIAGEKWQPVGVFKEALASMVEMLKGLGSFAIWTVVFSPVLYAFYLLAKYISRRITIK